MVCFALKDLSLNVVTRRRFFSRRDIVLRRITSTGRDLPKDTIKRKYSFLSVTSNLIADHEFTKGQILNMDKTAIYLDAPSNYTYSAKGATG